MLRTPRLDSGDILTRSRLITGSVLPPHLILNCGTPYKVSSDIKRPICINHSRKGVEYNGNDCSDAAKTRRVDTLIGGDYTQGLRNGGPVIQTMNQLALVKDSDV